MIVVIILVLIGGFFLLNKNNNKSIPNDNSRVEASNVFMENGVQIVEIKAKGGYQPMKSIAKAGIPTIIRFETDRTFDCSSSINIPSMKISKILPQSGNTDIDLGTQLAGLLRGSCGMGMYPFSIDFEN